MTALSVRGGRPLHELESGALNFSAIVNGSQRFVITRSKSENDYQQCHYIRLSEFDRVHGIRVPTGRTALCEISGVSGSDTEFDIDDDYVALSIRCVLPKAEG